jgi:hypothetical protein
MRRLWNSFSMTRPRMPSDEGTTGEDCDNESVFGGAGSRGRFGKNKRGIGDGDGFVDGVCPSG